MPDLALRDVTVEHTRDGYTIRALDNMSADAVDGELVLLLGPSGCGKTTLLSCLGGIMRPTHGSIVLGGVELRSLSDKELVAHRRRGAGFVFQAFNLIPSLTAEENVAAPLLAAGLPLRYSLRRAAELLELMDMADRRSHRPAHLSGGQQQRVAVARALAHDPPLLLADEPTANLDYVQAESVIQRLRALAGPGRLVVVATHDDRLLPIADRVVDMVGDETGDDGTAPGEVVKLKAGEVLFEQGTRGRLVYFVEDGEIEIVREDADGGIEALGVRGPGTYVGELGPMMGQPRSATARAKVRSRVRALTVQEFRVRQRGAVANR